MPISTGSTISASDINSAHTSTLSTLSTLRAKLPSLMWLNISFPAVVSGSADTFKTRDIVIPDDAIIAEIAVSSGEGNGADTISIDNGALLEPISISHTRGVGFLEATRWYSSSYNHNTSILLKGSVLTVSVSTTNTSATSNLQVSIGLFSEFRKY